MSLLASLTHHSISLDKTVSILVINADLSIWYTGKPVFPWSPLSPCKGTKCNRNVNKWNMLGDIYLPRYTQKEANHFLLWWEDWLKKKGLVCIEFALTSLKRPKLPSSLCGTRWNVCWLKEPRPDIKSSSNIELLEDFRFDSSSYQFRVNFLNGTLTDSWSLGFLFWDFTCQYSQVIDDRQGQWKLGKRR